MFREHEHIPTPAGWAAAPRTPISRATHAVYAALRAKAAKTSGALIVERARCYAERPWLLDLIEPGLCELSPRGLRFRIAVLLGEERGRQHIFRSETILINLKAAAVFAESMIDAEHAK